MTSTTISGSDRRIHPRFGVNFTLRFKRADELAEGGEKLEIAGTDLSVNGLGAAFSPAEIQNYELKPGTKLMIEIDFEDGGAPVAAAAKVMWKADSDDMSLLQFSGFKFVYIGDEAKQRIMDIIAAALPVSVLEDFSEPRK